MKSYQAKFENFQRKIVQMGLLQKLQNSIQTLLILTVIKGSATVTLLEQRPEKIQALSEIRTHDLCDASAVQ